MTEPHPTGRSDEEAAAWFARLQNPVVTQSDLRAWRTWREDPENDDAFRRQEAIWREAARLRSDVDIARAVHEALHVAPRWRRWRVPATVAVVLALVTAAWLTTASWGVQRFATGVGEQRIFSLADGSTVRLDARSRLLVHLTRKRRDLVLEHGRALFDVAHDVRRPFVVTAGDAQVTAVGTRFDVRRFPDARTQVILIQGQVRVRAGHAQAARSWTLSAGQQIADTSQPAPPAPADLDSATAWTTGRLVFHDVPIGDAIAEANRYNARPLELRGDSALAAVHIDGVFKAGDPRELAQALAALYGLQVEDAGRGPVVLRPRPAQAG